MGNSFQRPCRVERGLSIMQIWLSSKFFLWKFSIRSIVVSVVNVFINHVQWKIIIKKGLGKSK
jgi:hypothetical protein